MKKAFSLFEFLIVMAVVFILALIIFPYYHTAQQQLSLQRSANKLAQDIRRAQEMAMAAEEFGGSTPSGGYGVYLTTIASNRYILFADMGPSPNRKYDSGSEQIGNDILFESGIKIKTLDGNYVNIIFVPSDPTTFFTDNNGVDLSLDQVSIVISLDDETKSKTIIVNKAGLIDVE